MNISFGKESCETKLETNNKKKRSIKASLRADLLLVFDEYKMKKYVEKYQSREILVRGVDHLTFVKEFCGDRMFDIEALQRHWIPPRGVQHDEYKAEIENVAK
uniref:Uncharacterized protein n=1 Tax=Panagrolaimus davidi TaxID=227884 RepID=A0A914QXM8_9BILA